MSEGAFGPLFFGVSSVLGVLGFRFGFSFLGLVLGLVLGDRNNAFMDSFRFWIDSSGVLT